MEYDATNGDALAPKMEGQFSWKAVGCISILPLFIRVRRVCVLPASATPAAATKNLVLIGHEVRSAELPEQRDRFRVFHGDL